MAPRLTPMFDWLEARLGTRQQLTKFLYRRLPVGTTWWHTLGSAALFLIWVQTVTGFFLAFYFVPSPEHAYDCFTSRKRSRYFLFELLWKFPGKWIPVATFYIPLGVVLVLLFLPFFDRTTGRSPLKRPVATGIATVALAIIAAVTYQGAMAPAPPREGVTARQEANALLPGLAKGQAVYDAQGCSACHVLMGAGSAAGPDLTPVGARRDAAWLKRFEGPERGDAGLGDAAVRSS